MAITASSLGFPRISYFYLSASISSDHLNKGVYATVNRDRANFIWKLTQHGDSILIQNAGMDTYVSFSSPDENRVVMTTDTNDATHVVFDYAGYDFVQNDEKEFEKDIFYIRFDIVNLVL